MNAVGAAHTREKALAAAAERFVVMVSSNKLVERPAPPIPIELLGPAATLARLGHVRLRGVPRSPDGGVIADYLGEVDDPVATAARLSSTTGLIEHGLFAPALVLEILVARGEHVDLITARQPTANRIPPDARPTGQHDGRAGAGCAIAGYLGDHP